MPPGQANDRVAARAWSPYAGGTALGVRAVALILLLAAVSGCGAVDRLRARLDVKEGNLCYLRGEYALAVQHFDAALEWAPHLEMALLGRAYAYEWIFRSSRGEDERRHAADEAVSSYRAYLAGVAAAARSSSRSPSRDQIDQHIITLLLDSQQQDAAVHYLEDRLEREPEDSSTLQMLSRLEAERGRMDAALRWQRRQVELQPGVPEALYALGALAWRLSYRDPFMEAARRDSLLDEGMTALRQATELRPDYSDALVFINLIYLEKAKYAGDEAKAREFEAMAKTYRDSALALRSQPAGLAAPETSGAGGVTPADTAGHREAGGR